MQEHVVLALATGFVLHEPAPATFDLHPASRLRLNVLDITSPLTNHLRAKIKAINGLQIDGNALFGPFAAPKRVTLDRIGFSARSKATFIDKIRQFLFHELLDLVEGRIQAFFAGAGDVEVEWGSLYN